MAILFSMLVNHQIRHQAICKGDCSSDDRKSESDDQLIFCGGLCGYVWVNIFNLLITNKGMR